MPPTELLVPFFLATAVFACIPGPGMLFAAAYTIAGGRRTGWLSAVGLHIGGYAHIGAAAFGLAVVLQTIPVLYGIIKLVGAAYLVWLGFRFLATGQRGVKPVEPAPAVAEAPSRTVRRSIVVELLNPKTALFYLAFLPQFTDRAAELPVWAQILILGLVVNVMFSATDIVCVLMSAGVTRVLRTSRAATRVARWIGGGVLVGLGVNLAASRQ